MNNGKIQIAVIDDGVNEKLYSTGDLLHNVEVLRDLRICERKGYDPYSPSHGTTCAAIIIKYSPDAVLSSIKILDSGTMKGIRKQLLKAIEWCVENDIRLVNLSLGTIDYRDFAWIRKTVNSACKKGLVIVAACNNKNVFTYPAALSNVIGVRCINDDMTMNRTIIFSSALKRNYTYNDYVLDGIEVTAPAGHRITDCFGEKNTTPVCNSFAAPFVTAVVHEILSRNPRLSVEEIKDELRKGAKNKVYEKPYLTKNIEWAEKAAVFYLNNAGIQPFQMHYVFKVHSSHTIKCDKISSGLSQVLQHLDDNAVSFSLIDTVVIIISGSIQRSEITFFINRMSSAGKNVVYLDDAAVDNKVDIVPVDKALKIWHPSIYRYLEQNNYAVVSSLQHDAVNRKVNEVPILCMYDFSGNHLIEIMGKLSSLFKKAGYNILCAANTCVGIAADFEFIPFSSGTGQYGASDAAILETLYRIYDPDLVLIGFDAIDAERKDTTKIVETDIKILLGNPENSIVVMHTGKSDANKNTFIQPKAFDYYDPVCITELYRYILYCFKRKKHKENKESDQ